MTIEKLPHANRKIIQFTIAGRGGAGGGGERSEGMGHLGVELSLGRGS